MNMYAMTEGVEIAALRCMLAIQEAHKDEIGVVLSAVAQHPAAILASAVDDAWVDALNKRGL